jgi:hypothetical protein
MIMPKVHVQKDKDATRWIVWCVACEEHHAPIEGRWTFNGDLEKPTFSPSLVVRGKNEICHSFIRDGYWEYLSDCTHGMAGQKVEMVDVDW